MKIRQRLHRPAAMKMRLGTIREYTKVQRKSNFVRFPRMVPSSNTRELIEVMLLEQCFEFTHSHLPCHRLHDACHTIHALVNPAMFNEAGMTLTPR